MKTRARTTQTTAQESQGLKKPVANRLSRTPTKVSTNKLKRSSSHENFIQTPHKGATLGEGRPDLKPEMAW